MSQARLLIDLDGTTVDMMKKWLDQYNKDYNDNLTVNDIKDWDTHKWVKKECGKKIYHYLSRPGFFRDLEPYPHAIDVLGRLSKDFDVVIVTASPRIGHSDKTLWVRNNLPFIPRRNIIFAHRKDLVRGDLLFDDSPDNLDAFPGITVALRHEYNKHVNSHLVGSWLEFEDFVLKLFINKQKSLDKLEKI